MDSNKVDVKGGCEPGFGNDGLWEGLVIGVQDEEMCDVSGDGGVISGDYKYLLT